MSNTKPHIRLTEPVRLSGPLTAPAMRPVGTGVKIYPATSEITSANRWDHFLARWGYRRSQHRVKPGLYALGAPVASSPVFVTANYTLSFDAVRGALAGRNAYILVLDTKGINVWCAAGKGTFGTEELVHRIQATNLHRVVGHRKLTAQLGASGVSAHEVRRRSGFRVEYGPVRAAELPGYLDSGQATPTMRRVTFTVGERLVLVPVELTHTVVPMLVAAVALFFLSGLWGAIGAVVAVLAGTVLFPLLLPWVPTREFSTKGLILGEAVALPIALAGWQAAGAWPWGLRVATLAAYLIGFPAVTAYLALNFTGSTPLTSKSWVKREMSRYIPIMAGMAGVAVLLFLTVAAMRWIGG